MKRFLLCSVVLLALLAASAANAADPIGTVVGIQGPVQAVGDDGSPRSLQMKSPVFLNDTIRCGSSAKVQIMFTDDTLFAQGADSEVVIDQYVFSPDRKESNGLIFRLSLGLFRIVTGKIAELNPERFEVKTGRATIGIRGCDLAGRLTAERDEWLLFRIPPGKRIVVDATAATGSRGADATRLLEITQDGVAVFVDDAGRLWRMPLMPEDWRAVLTGTGIQLKLAQAGRGTGPSSHGPSPEPLSLSPPASGGGPGFPVFPNDPQPPLPPEPYPVDPAPYPPELPPPPEEPTGTRPPEGGGGGGGIAPPVLRLSGGAVGATYFGTPPAQQVIQNTYIYRDLSGSFSDFEFSGSLDGRVFDPAGNVVGMAAIPLVNVPLSGPPSGGPYAGYIEFDSGGGILIANDNLHQFVRRVNPNDDTQILTFWGYEASSYPGSRLPADSTVRYEVDIADIPPQRHGGTPVPAVEDGMMTVNTRNGCFVIEHSAGVLPPQFGRVDKLTFYGEESQGVGAIQPMPGDPGSPVPSFHAGAVAGFKQLGSELPVETGTRSGRGYAMGVGFLEGTVPTTVRDFSSADMLSDTTSDNEGRVGVFIDRDAGLVNAHMAVFQNPAAPVAASDIQVGPPDESFYVNANNYSAEFMLTDSHVVMFGAQPAGENWRWGQWEGERVVDYGGGPQNEHLKGEYVEGDTLDPSGFQGLVMGSQSYTLSTPAGHPGHASANVVNGNFHAHLEGTADLTVNIPGGGAAATWSGDFDLDDGPNSLSVSYNNRNISANGHLRGGSPDSYSLDADGNSYNGGDLTEARVTGNLVGPMSGSRPVTGAIGSGRFEHNDGTKVKLLFGTDLQ